MLDGGQREGRVSLLQKPSSTPVDASLQEASRLQHRSPGRKVPGRYALFARRGQPYGDQSYLTLIILTLVWPDNASGHLGRNTASKPHTWRDGLGLNFNM